MLSANAELDLRWPAVSLFSVLDDTNPRSLNVVGFDVSTPSLISAFVAGQL